MHAGTTLYWSFKRKAATHSIKAAPSLLRMRHPSKSAKVPPHAARAMTPLEWRTGGRTYTARWPHTDKPGSSMGSTFSYMPPANTGMSAVQWHMFGLRKTTATGRYTTAVATAAPARSGLICAAKSRRAQPEARAPSLKGPAMVNTVNVSCSSDTDAALGLATADKQRAGLVGNQTDPRHPLTDCREEGPVGVDAAVPVASGNALEGAAAQMQESSPQVQCMLSCSFVPGLGQILPCLCMLRVCFQSRFDFPLCQHECCLGIIASAKQSLCYVHACCSHSLSPNSRKSCHLVHCNLCN